MGIETLLTMATNTLEAAMSLRASAFDVPLYATNKSAGSSLHEAELLRALLFWEAIMSSRRAVRSWF